MTHATVPRVWRDVGYRPLPDGDGARPLFDFAALPWPEPAKLAFAWGAFAAMPPEGERLVGAVLAERAGRAMFLHGPVVVAREEALEIAAQLVTAALDHGTALGGEVIFVRPQGLDRVWIRFGFIPVPESTLPGALAGRAGVGLYAWRGGSALWTLRESPRE
ncbi:MAG: hypothetical protein ACREJV_08665 [Candidatus Rokuibacteriota bacterium]